MKNILIIYPHWVPSNLAGVHRARLIANYLKEFGWQPILLTVKPEFYEEKLDPDISRTASEEIEVHSVDAFKVMRPRILGDIGLRSFLQIRKEALRLITERSIEFIWIPIPSYYMALMGRLLHEATGVPYGIDYIDPWVEDITNRESLRARLSVIFARILEPIAVKKAALISGVSTPYYQPVLDRNFNHRKITHVGMPYGFDPHDHKVKLDNIKLPWEDTPDCKPWVYAGAFLPNSHLFIDCLFKSISEMKSAGQWEPDVQLYFLGTGPYKGKQIIDYAAEYGIASLVHEKRERYPFLHILNFLSAADVVMVIGSTEKHYTASKIFQSLLSERPVFAVFHEESSAVDVLHEAHAENYLVKYREEITFDELKAEMKSKLEKLLVGKDLWTPDLKLLDKFSSRQSARSLAQALEEALVCDANG